MIKMGKESRLVPSEVIQEAVGFFGPSGVGLSTIKESACCVRFEGGGGHVYVQTSDIEGGEGSSVTVEGREWEYQIKQFMGKI
jgi:hypothetical protein